MLSSEGFLYTSSGATIFGGPSRPPPIHLGHGHGRKPTGARRVVTAPATSEAVLGPPTRTPAASRMLAKGVRKVEEVPEQQISVTNKVLDPRTPASIRRTETETPVPVHVTAQDSPLLPILPPTAGLVEEDLKDASMLQAMDVAKEMESPVPVGIAAMVPLPLEVDDEEGVETGVVGMINEITARFEEEATAPTLSMHHTIATPITTKIEFPVPVPIVEASVNPNSTLEKRPVSTEPPADRATSPAPADPKEVTSPLKEPDNVPVQSIVESNPVAVSLVEEATSVPLTADKSEEEVTLRMNGTTATAQPIMDEVTCPPASPEPASPKPGDQVTPTVTSDHTVSVGDEELRSDGILTHDAAQAVVSTTEAEPAPEVHVAEQAIPPTSEPSMIDEALAATESASISPGTGEIHMPASSPPVAEPVVSCSPIVEADMIAVQESKSHVSMESSPDQLVEPTPPPTAGLPVAPACVAEVAIHDSVANTIEPPAIDPIVPISSASQVQVSAPTVAKANPASRAPISRPIAPKPTVKPVQAVKPTTAPLSAAAAPARKPPVPRAAAVSRPIRPVERKTFRPVTAAQSAAAAALAKVRSDQAQAQIEKSRAPSRTAARPPVGEPRSRVPSATSSVSHDIGGTIAPTKTKPAAISAAPLPVPKPTKSTLLAPTKASASRAVPTAPHPVAKPASVVSNSALPPVRKERIKLKAALPSFRPVRSGQLPASGPGPSKGTWNAFATSTSARSVVPRAAAIPLPSSPPSSKSIVAQARPETIALPPSPIAKVRPEHMPLPAGPDVVLSLQSSASRTIGTAKVPAAVPLPTSPTPIAAEVPLPSSPVSQASHRSQISSTRAASPAISVLQARLAATPSRNSSAPTMSDRGLDSDSDSEGQDESAGVTFKVKSDNSRSQSSLKTKLNPKSNASGDLMEFSAPARMQKIYLGSTTPMYTPGRKALVIRDANLASPLVKRKVVREE